MIKLHIIIKVRLDSSEYQYFKMSIQLFQFIVLISIIQYICSLDNNYHIHQSHILNDNV